MVTPSSDLCLIYDDRRDDSLLTSMVWWGVGSGYLGWWDSDVDNTSNSESDGLIVITGQEPRRRSRGLTKTLKILERYEQPR